MKNQYHRSVVQNFRLKVVCLVPVVENRTAENFGDWDADLAETAKHRVVTAEVYHQDF